TTPVGAGKSNPVQVVVSGQASNTNIVFNYDGPQITNVQPSTGPTSGGTTLTISGQSFGTTGIVQVGGNSCPLLPNTYTQSQVQCQLPVGEGVNQTVVLTTSNTPSNSWPFNYIGPTLTSVVPSNGPTAGNVPIVISGNNFGVAAFGVATVGGLVCSPI